MKNTLKIILISLLSFYCFVTFAWDANSIKGAIMPEIIEWVINNSEQNIVSDNTLLDKILKFVSESIFKLIWIIATGVFIFIWARLVIAKWNPEEFKKAIMSFIYAIAWLFIITASWWVVKLVSTINL